MIFDKKGTTTIITQEKATIVDFVKRLEEQYEGIQNDNIIVNLFSLRGLTKESIVEFLSISKKHQLNKRSFVIVNDTIIYDDIPNELIVVPTLQEAFDLIEMEEIERDLGF